MKRKNYEKPTTKVVKLQHHGMLMTSGEVPQSKGASIDNYEDGEFTW